MRTMCSREISTKKCRQQQIFDSNLKGAWHYNHVTSTPIAKNCMLYCRLIYMLSILCVRHMIKVKVGIPESFKVGWYPPKKLGRVTLTGGWKTWKKYILQPPRQKKNNSCMAAPRKKNHVCMVQPRKKSYKSQTAQPYL